QAEHVRVGKLVDVRGARIIKKIVLVDAACRRANGLAELLDERLTAIALHAAAAVYALFPSFSSRRRHTRCLSDWSSDVCSSDVPVIADPGETPAGTAGAGTADLTLDAKVAAADVPPELLAQSLGQYLRAWWLRVRGGNSGVLPVVLGIVVVAVGFQIANSKFLSAQNLVNLFEQSTVYMLLAMAEIFALLLGEIDLSVGLVMGLGSVVVAELVQPSGANWPWWAAIIA